jgi:2-succinyl-5-enolpyruvyl-6-hydroxy-3-cyclohexene-1-carboxylate synthase
MEYSSKENAQYLRQIAKEKGILNVVFSPGSRNAPLVIELKNDTGFNCITIPDERTAGFVALGQAISSGRPSILVCTSGSALLNYYPAIAEAFYQKVPLIVASADRPTEWVDQQDGQTIRQDNVFANHILYSSTLFKDGGDEQTRLSNQRVINEALNCSLENDGPVHLNFPFLEPLYDTTRTLQHAKIIRSFTGDKILGNSEVERLSTFWNSSVKKIVLVGQISHNIDLGPYLDFFTKDESTVVFTETIANCSSKESFNSIDRLMDLDDNEAEQMTPDILLTIGNAIISKKVKNFLREHRPAEHWHLSSDQNHPDTYQSLTHSIKIAPEVFLNQFMGHINNVKSNYQEKWGTIEGKRTKAHTAFIEAVEYSDLWVYNQIVQNLQDNTHVHWANSTAIRYAQLFDFTEHIKHFCNRGTSGIEGSTSTAFGFALESKKPTLAISGDISFFYDTNAFFGNNLPKNLKVIVVNNSGGGIFRFIPGPGTTDHLEDVFESKHTANVEGIAKAHNVKYINAKNEQELLERLPQFLSTFTEAAILEVNTPDEASAELLRHYFKALRNG